MNYWWWPWKRREAPPTYLLGQMPFDLLRARTQALIDADIEYEPAMCQPSYNPPCRMPWWYPQPHGRRRKGKPTKLLPGFHAQPTAHVTRVFAFDYTGETVRAPSIDPRCTITMPTLAEVEV